jgi:hypothetical protein
MAQVFNRGGRRERIKWDDSVVRASSGETQIPFGNDKQQGE